MIYRVKLSRVNSILLVAIVVVNLYTILAPLLPAAAYKLHNNGGTAQARLQSKVVASTPPPAINQPNEVIIPSMLLEKPILEGPTRNMYKILDQGIWHWPMSSTPDKGSNTVLLGHRFTYTNPNGVLYHFDNLYLYAAVVAA
jgi:sortase (surface protein transpeptidase)